MVVVLWSTDLEATDYTWTGSSDASTWGDQGNWDSGDGTPGDDGFPDDSGDTATFGSTAHTITTGAARTIGALTLNGAFAGTLTLSGNLVLDGATHSADLTVTSGTFATSTHNLVLEADLTVNGGTFTGGSGDSYVSGDVTLSTGTLTANSGTMALAGNWTKSGGTFNDNSGTMLLSSSTDQAIDPTGTTFNSLSIGAGLLGYWKFDESSGSTAADSSGNGLNGTWRANTTNSGTTPSGIDYANANSIEFDGTGDYIDVPSISLPTGDFTYAAWIYPDTNTDETIFMSTDGSGGNELLLRVFGTLQLFLDNSSTTGSATISTGTWSHIAVTRSGSTVTYYINGSVDITRTMAQSLSFGGVLLIGADADSGTVGGISNEFDGKIDDARVYTRALNATEVLALANGGSARGPVGTYTLSADLDLDGDFSLNSGTFSPGTRTINVGGDFTYNGGTYTVGTSTLVMDGTSGTNTLTSNGINFNDITFNDGGGTATYQLTDALDVAGTLTLTDGIVDTNGFDISISGNWAGGSGTLTGTDAVIFDGTGTSVISGSTTFYDLNCTTAGKQINFTASTTQTISNNLNMTGTAGNMIKLRSTSGGVKWDITFSGGAQAITNVDVQDSDGNTNNVTVTDGIDNGNNNANWIFSGSPFLYWVGGTGNWSDNTNHWSTTSGGAAGASVPTGSKLAVFDSNSGTGTATLDVDVDCGGITLNSSNITISQGSSVVESSSLTITSGTFAGGSGPITVDSAVTVNGGAFTSTSDLLRVTGTFTHSSGTFTHNSGHVLLDGTSSSTLTLNSTTFNDLTINEGLVGYWKFDETSGSIAYDSSGHRNDGQYFADTTQSTSVPGVLDFDSSRSVDFDGNGDYIDVNNMTLPTGDMTYACWVNLDDTTDECFFMHTDGSGSNEMLLIVQLGTARVFLNNSTIITGGTSLSTGTWYHLAFTRSGSAVSLYVNGALDGSGTHGTAITAPGPLLIGCDADSGSKGSLGNWVNGRMDEARVYSRGLSSTEISRLASGIQPRSSQVTTTMSSALDVNGDLVVHDGTLATGNNNITVAGDVLFTGGVLTSGSETFTMDGAGGTSVLLAGGNGFNNLTINDGGGAAHTTQLSGALDVNGDLSITDGVLDQNGYLVTLSGNWTTGASGSLTSGAAAVTFDGTGTQTLETGGTGTGNDFGYFVVNGTGNTVELQTSGLDIDNALTISSGTLSLAGNNISTVTSFSNSGTIRLRGNETLSWTTNDTDSGTFEFTGDGDSARDQYSLPTFTGDDYYQLTVNSTDEGADLFEIGSSIAITNGLTLTTGTVTAGSVTITMSASGSVAIGAVAGVPAIISFDGTILTSTTPGTDRYSFAVNAGGDITAKQTTRFDSLTAAGMTFATGSSLGSNTTGSDGFSRFSFVTFDNIPAAGVGMDLSGLVAGDNDRFPDSLREIRFDGNAAGINVRAGAATPTMQFHVQTGDFGTVEADGESGDDDASNRIDWFATSTWVSLTSLRAVGNGPGSEVRILWSTDAELDNLGFHVYRSSNRHGPFVRLNVDILPAGDGATFTGQDYEFVDPLPDPGEIYYYRLEDVDADGTRTHHGPVCVDWDADGMPDDWEIAAGLDPSDPGDAAGDPDGDGLTNLQEFQRGLDPRSSDSDGDGIRDDEDTASPWQVSGDPILGGADGFRILSRDDLGMTVELSLGDLVSTTVRHDYAGWTDSDPGLVFDEIWSPMTFSRLGFSGASAEYPQDTGSPRIPLKRLLVNLPRNRVPRVEILEVDWGSLVETGHPPEPVPFYEDRPDILRTVRVESRTRRLLKIRSRSVTRIVGYERKVQIWASLFGGRSYKERFLEETVEVEEPYEEEVVDRIEIPVAVPSSRVVAVHGMNRPIYAQLEAGIEAPRFGVESQSRVGERDAALLAVRPVRVLAGGGRFRLARRMILRINHVWDPEHLSESVAEWVDHYADAASTGPQWVGRDDVFRIRVRKPAFGQDGDHRDFTLVRLETADIQGAGLDVMELASDPSRLRLFLGETELSLRESGSNWLFPLDRGLLETLYNDHVVLHGFVGEPGSGRRWLPTPSEPGFDVQATSVRHRIRWERQGTFSPIYQEGTPDAVFVHPSSLYNGQSRTYQFRVPDPVAGPASLTTRLWGQWNFEPALDQSVELRIGGAGSPLLGTRSWGGRSFDLATTAVPDGSLSDGVNLLRLTGALPAGVPKQRVRVDWWAMAYPRALMADGDRYVIMEPLAGGSDVTAGDVVAYDVSGFTDPESVWVIDATDLGSVREITGAVRAGSSVSFRYRHVSGTDTVVSPAWLHRDSDFGPDDPNGRGPESGDWSFTGQRLLLIDPSVAVGVDDVTLMDRPDLRGRRSPVDHILIVDDSLAAEAQRLVDHLASRTVPDDGVFDATGAGAVRPMRVEIVRFGDLVHSQGWGIAGTGGLRRYLQERWRTALIKPRYVTLVGSGNWNVKGIWNFPTELALIPSPIVRGGIKAAAADWDLVDVDGNGFPDMSIGRLDVGTVAELSDVIDKVIDYDRLEFPTEPEAVLVSDSDSTIPDVFDLGIDMVASQFESPWLSQRLSAHAGLSAPQIRSGILDALSNRRISLLVYNGHGNFTTWASNFSVGDLGALNAGHHLPLVIEANCLSSDYFHISPRSLGTHWLQRPGAGAVAVIGTTGRTSAFDKVDVLTAVARNLSLARRRRFGDALWHAKVDALTRQGGDPVRAIVTQHLLGIPSQELK